MSESEPTPQHYDTTPERAEVRPAEHYPEHDHGQLPEVPDDLRMLLPLARHMVRVVPRSDPAWQAIKAELESWERDGEQRGEGPGFRCLAEIKRLLGHHDAKPRPEITETRIFCPHCGCEIALPIGGAT
jgi:hypothetical protein